MIREMKAADASAVWEIFTTALGYNCDLEVVRRRIDELAGDTHCLTRVWLDDATGEVKGFIHAMRYETLHREGGWDVISLAVLPSAQGQGIGRALLQSLEAYVLENGGSYVRLNSRVNRKGAHRFYECVGYTCDKQQKRFIKQLA